MPAESTATTPLRPAAAKASASMRSAIGERQMFPVQTAMIRYGFDDGGMQLSMVRVYRFVNGNGSF